MNSIKYYFFNLNLLNKKKEEFKKRMKKNFK